MIMVIMVIMVFDVLVVVHVLLYMHRYFVDLVVVDGLEFDGCVDDEPLATTNDRD